MAQNFFGLDRGTIDDLLPILGGVAGAFPTSTTGNSLTETNSNATSNLTTLSQLLAQLNGTQQQTISPQIQALIDKATAVSGQQLQGTNLQPFVAQQTAQINRNSQLQKQAADNIMASRGLSTSPVAGTTQANIDAQRIAGITNLQQSLPMLQAQLAQQALAGATGVAAAAPRGTTTSQTSSQTGQTGQSTVQNMSGSQKVQQQQKQGGGVGGAIGGFASLLASLFA